MHRRSGEEETRMADFPPDATSQEETGRPPGTPRWVIAFGIIAIVVVVLIGFILVTGLGGPHGPQRHAPSGYASGHAPPITAA
jgi:hypothetical protein